ncbi:MAG: MBL fold metallo-hydrolase [Bacteroidia bacterium]|nr:MBL fold metallo-hydrolase [Bacteroidia bacterium]
MFTTLIRLSLAGLLVSFFVSCQNNKPRTVASGSDDVHAHNQAILNTLPFSDSTDFVNADSGFIATRTDPIIRNPDGGVAYDLSAFDFVDGPAPSTTNPSLWRQSILNRKHGLYKVADGIYQVRGFDLANITFVESDNGWIIIDVLTTAAPAKAALELVNENLGERPIKAIIFTHSHIDHFGGIKGIVSEEQIKNEGIEIIAPEGFYESAITENIIAGNAMIRRSTYMYGFLIPQDTAGFIGSGLGQKVSTGEIGLVEPTLTIDQSEQTVIVDGLEMVFMNTPGAEAPAECMFYIPKYKAFCQAEEINHTLHNLYTLRGAAVRNGLLWSKYIDKTIERFGEETEISFGTHHWPTWGNTSINTLWARQRDVYKYIHDETLHLANKGYTSLEIAEMIRLPEALSGYFANRDYYGTLSHNSKAQYQLYYGWFDGNPANLNTLPPRQSAEKYVEYMGGAAAIMTKVDADIQDGNFRWAATALNHVVFANPGNQAARNKLAEVYEQMAYIAESGPWRNFYLTGAQELRNGIVLDLYERTATPEDILTNMSLETFYDYMAVRLDRSKSTGKSYVFNMVFPDIDEVISLYFVNDVLHNRPGVLAPDPNATITMNKSVFNEIILQKTTGLRKMLSGDIKIEGSKSDYSDFQKMMETPFELFFNIIEP